MFLNLKCLIMDNCVFNIFNMLLSCEIQSMVRPNYLKLFKFNRNTEICTTRIEVSAHSMAMCICFAFDTYFSTSAVGITKWSIQSLGAFSIRVVWILRMTRVVRLLNRTPRVGATNTKAVYKIIRPQCPTTWLGASGGLTSHLCWYL